MAGTMDHTALVGQVVWRSTVLLPTVLNGPAGMRVIRSEVTGVGAGPSTSVLTVVLVETAVW